MEQLFSAKSASVNFPEVATRHNDNPYAAPFSDAAEEPSTRAAKLRELRESPLADRISRLAASIIDWVFLIACCVVSFPIAILIHAAGQIAGLRLLMHPGVIGLVVGFAIQSWLITATGQSVGKYLFKMRIVRVTDGMLPGFVHGVLLRFWLPTALNAVPVLGFIFSLVDICWIFGPDRRCVHDHFAGTKVITLRPVH